MENLKANILYVDDERENLDGFEASFYNVYNIFLADNGKSGLEILRNKEIHVIVSDQRMPEMTGLEFFAEVQKKYPDIVCIILTAHVDSESSIRAVNQGGIYRYILKPWDKNEMKMSLDNAVEREYKISFPFAFKSSFRNRSKITGICSSISSIHLSQIELECLLIKLEISTLSDIFVSYII